jgi:hypothetical protein
MNWATTAINDQFFGVDWGQDISQNCRVNGPAGSVACSIPNVSRMERGGHWPPAASALASARRAAYSWLPCDPSSFAAGAGPPNQAGSAKTPAMAVATKTAAPTSRAMA